MILVSNLGSEAGRIQRRAGRWWKRSRYINHLKEDMENQIEQAGTGSVWGWNQLNPSPAGWIVQLTFDLANSQPLLHQLSGRSCVGPFKLVGDPSSVLAPSSTALVSTSINILSITHDPRSIFSGREAASSCSPLPGSLRACMVGGISCDLAREGGESDVVVTFAFHDGRLGQRAQEADTIIQWFQDILYMALAP